MLTRQIRKCRKALVVHALAIMAVATGLQAGDWRVETVDANGPGLFTSLKVDKWGNVHVAYVSETDLHPLRYAFWDNSMQRWFTTKVADNASFCTLVLDSQQNPRISYADFGTALGANLRYARWDGSSWKIDPIVIQPGAVVGYYTSIALDAQDRPFFSYYDYADPSNTFRLRMRSVFWLGQYWGAQTVDAQSGSGKFNSIAVDSKGNPSIAYANVKAEYASLRFGTWDGHAWKTDVIEGANEPLPIFSVALALDKTDNPHIVYSSVNEGLLKYARRKDGKWTIETVDQQAAGYPDRNGIALDSDGNPYLSYHDEQTGTLRLAYKRNGKWIREVLEGGYAGFTSSIAVTRDSIWISYAQQAEQSMKVAHRRLDAPVSASVTASAGSSGKL